LLFYFFDIINTHKYVCNLTIAFSLYYNINKIKTSKVYECAACIVYKFYNCSPSGAALSLENCFYKKYLYDGRVARAGRPLKYNTKQTRRTLSIGLLLTELEAALALVPVALVNGGVLVTIVSAFPVDCFLRIHRMSGTAEVGFGCASNGGPTKSSNSCGKFA